MPAQIKSIIFDFDGVIIDSYDATIHYIQKTIKQANQPVPNREDFNGLLGLKVRDIIQKVLPPNIPDEEIDIIYEQGKKNSIAAIPLIKLTNKADKVVAQLAKDYSLAIASSRSEKSLNILLDQYDIRLYFQSIISREDTTHHKPHPEPILKALKELGTKPNQAIYIGDMQEDILAAKTAKVTSILVTNKPTQTYDADFVIKNITEFNKLKKGKLFIQN